MKRNRFHEMSNHTLVGRFVELALGQDDADLVRTIAGTIDYSGERSAVAEELKRRPGDARRALVRLYNHPNPQVRKTAADATLAVEPEAARQVLYFGDCARSSKGRCFNRLRTRESIRKRGAGMSLCNLDRGVFKPT